jgi:hypothetical protein
MRKLHAREFLSEGVALHNGQIPQNGAPRLSHQLARPRRRFEMRKRYIGIDIDDDVPLVEVIVAALLCEGARRGELAHCYPDEQERFLRWARIELNRLAVRGIELLTSEQ